MPDTKPSEMVKRVKDKLSEFDLDGASGFYDEELTKAAQAAIEAMREPTEKMINAKIDTAGLTRNHDGSTVTGYHPPIRQPDHIDWWQAMIDAALKE